MNKLSSEVQDATFTFHKFVGIGAGELGMTPCEACGALERDPVHADKFRVSEAAPERIWIQKDTSFFQATGNGTYYRDPDKNSIEYARVHQPPEQNSDKNSGEPKPTAPSHSSVVVSGDSSESAYDHATYWDLNDIAGRRGYSLAHLPYVETPAARRELIDWLTVYDKRLLVPTPITQASASASALSTTVPDPGQASFTDSESESTLVTAPDVQAAEMLREGARDYATRAARLQSDGSAAALNFAHDYSTKAEVLREYADKLESAASPVQPEVSKEQQK